MAHTQSAFYMVQKLWQHTGGELSATLAGTLALRHRVKHNCGKGRTKHEGVNDIQGRAAMYVL